ncbi:DUF1329 domain-containing protein [Azospirillum soli]|uniref:DUF1329 domain-containing protein n=1 Tax=Azospirillum soli TaxID=1304799 RepID=UPI001AE1A1C4|nr:DUF1329 domain-containing protein [Azospirillum soli]MBP2313518.1 hypothetical protein [Azospirillum soli]
MKRLLATLLLMLSLPAAAPAAAEEAPVPALGIELTPYGAVRAGNRTRAIPAWTGGLTQAPKDHAAGRHVPDPYDEDGRWFTVGPADIDRYKLRLSAGLQALLQKHPTSFEIPLFPTRRSAAFPQRVYDETLENATRAKLGENGLALSGAKIGVPFPLPANGVQAMWNHILRWRGETVSRTSATILPTQTGELPQTLYREDRLSTYAAGQEGRPAFYRRTALSPKGVPGATLLLHGTLNPIQSGFSAWFRAGETGKGVRAPDFAYDTPDPATGGIRTADMLDMFSGPLDRFDFTLVSRREMYVPYNAYRMNTPSLAPVDFLWPNHPNPQFLRYEMHRVWVVEAKVKPGYRHALPERTYYLDEDSWQIVMADHYNAKGELVRYSEVHGITDPRIPVFYPAIEITYDLAGDRYVISGVDNLLKPPAFGTPMKPEEFAPETLTKRGRR